MGPRGSPGGQHQCPGPQVAPLSLQPPVAAFLLTAGSRGLGSSRRTRALLCAAPRLLDLTDLTSAPDDPDIAAQKPHETTLAVGSCASPAQTG